MWRRLKIKKQKNELLEQKWDIVRLGNEVTPINDNEHDPLKKGIKKYVAGPHIESKKFNIRKYGLIEQDRAVIGSAFHRKFKKNNLLYVTRNPHLQKASVVTFDGICANTTLVLEVTNKQLIKELLPFIFQWEKFVDFSIEISVGSTNPYIRWRDLENFEFELPTKSHQLRIAKILCSIQKKIDSAENLLNSLNDFKNSLLEKFYTAGINNDDFKKEKWLYKKIIKIPITWNFEKLENCIAPKTIITYGIVQAGPDVKNGVPYIRTNDITSDEIKNEKLFRTTAKIDKQYQRTKLKKRDIICGVRATVGAFHIIGDSLEGANLSRGVARISPRKNLNSKFLFYALQSKYVSEQFKMITKGTTFPEITIAELRNIRIPIPNSKKEQERIGDTISNIDEKIQKSRMFVGKMYSLRKQMTDSLLTKEIVIQEDKSNV